MESQPTAEGSSRTGNMLFGITVKEQDVLDMLLKVKTYDDAAKRLGVTENAVKKRMSRVYSRYVTAKSFCNQVEHWKRKRREARRRF